MAPWLIALIFVTVLAGGGWLVDARARRTRRGLTSYSTPNTTHQPHSAAEGNIPGNIAPPSSLPAMPYPN
jgi:hypothetical protein